MGSAGRSRELSDILIKSAKIIGRKIAKEDCILVTGACMGIPHITAQSALKEGGLVIGYSPAKNIREHIEPPISYPKPPEGLIPIFTGYDKVGRNVLSIRECDGIIFIGGGIGTLNEFSIACHEGKIIGVLEGVGGSIEKIIGITEDFRGHGAIIIKDKNPKRLVEKVVSTIKEKKEEPRKEIPITFRNEGGKQLIGILHLPEKEKPPLVIIASGFQLTKSEGRYVKLARFLREKGILVFRFDFEGCGDSEGDPREITVEREVSDLSSALKVVLRECDVDSKKIGFVGESLGSVVVTLFIERFKIPIKSLVFWAPAFNQKELFKIWYEKKDLEEIRKKGFLAMGMKQIGKNYYFENKDKDYSSAFLKLNLPILILHGKKDEDVPLDFSKELAKGSKNITLRVLDKANHKFEDSVSQRKLISYTTNWFNKKL